MLYRHFVSGLERVTPRFLFLAFYGIVAVLKTAYILYFRYGHMKSAFLWQSIDRSGSPIPWFSYPAIEYLDGLDISGMSVFEYGSGNSTLYWQRRAKSVYAVEDNPEWATRVILLLGNQSACLHLISDNSDYPASIGSLGKKFGIIVIDGSSRFECAEKAVSCLQDSGIIILDDADHHTDAAAHLRDAGLLQIDFAGFAPINGYTKTTSFFFNKHFIPIPVGQAMPKHSIGHIC
jgi:hypothetical protein